MKTLTPIQHKTVAIVLHDVAAETLPACERVLDCIASLGNPPITLLAVPRYHGGVERPQLALWLDKALARGDEIALHGYTHLDDAPATGPLHFVEYAKRRWYTAGEGEFATLSYKDAEARLRLGMKWFGKHGWPISGFVAPAWLMSKGTQAALFDLNFDYTCTLSHLVSIETQRSLYSQSLVYSTRSAWRRMVSIQWNKAVAALQTQSPLLRFELHPQDADFKEIRNSWMPLLKQALQERHSVTLSTAARNISSIHKLAR